MLKTETEIIKRENPFFSEIYDEHELYYLCDEYYTKWGGMKYEIE
jgi:hypothetical protein